MIFSWGDTQPNGPSLLTVGFDASVTVLVGDTFLMYEGFSCAHDKRACSDSGNGHCDVDHRGSGGSVSLGFITLEGDLVFESFLAAFAHSCGHRLTKRSSLPL